MHNLFSGRTRDIFQDITSTLQNSTSMPINRQNKDLTTPKKSAENEVKGRFNREFEEVESCHSTPQAHSITPISSICNFDDSYVNHDIPDVDDLIEACANIHLNQFDSTFQTCQLSTGESNTTLSLESNSDPLNLTQETIKPDIVKDNETFVVLEKNFKNVSSTCVDFGDDTFVVDESTDIPEKGCVSLLPYVSVEENIFSKIKAQLSEHQDFNTKEFEVIEETHSNDCPLLEEIIPSNLTINKTFDYLDISNDTNEEFYEHLNNTIIVKETPMNLLPPAPQEEDKEKEQSVVPEEILSTSLEQSELYHNVDEPYEGFDSQRESTCPEEYENNLKTLELAAQEIVDRINKSSLEDPTFDDNHFVSASSQFFEDSKNFDILLKRSHSDDTICDLRKNSIYVQFDPLLRTSMLPVLPQAFSERILNEQPNEKSEITTSANANVNANIKTPIRHGPALAAIDNLIFLSPLSRKEEISETEDTTRIKEQSEPKTDSSTIMIDEHAAKQLELVKSTLSEMHEELEKQKQENELKDKEIERQKFKIEQLEAQLKIEIKCKNEMSVVVSEYEKSISRTVSEREKDRLSFEQEKNRLLEELQESNRHLTNTESAFNDVHMKYERLKGVVSIYKSNETVLKDSITENGATIKTLESRYEQLKTHAMSQLEKANLELDGIQKSHEAEKVKLEAMLQKSETKQNSLAQENKELSRILDEVLERVGLKKPQ